MLPPGTFAGKVAIVTGGGTGLGRAIANELARLGSRVVVASRNLAHLQTVSDEIVAAGADAMAIACDVRDPGQVQHLFEQVGAAFGPPDILVNNAAGNFLVEADKLSVNGWRAVLGIVLDGTFYCTREAGTRMIDRGSGAILNVIATYAWTGNPGTVHSASAKAGVLAMTRTLAVEWADHRISVKAIAAGPAATSGAGDRLWADGDVDRVAQSIPLKPLATPEEIADAAAFLLSDYASFITGECLVIDSGNWLGKAMFPYRSEPG